MPELESGALNRLAMTRHVLDLLLLLFFHQLASTQSSLQDQNKKFKEQTKQMKTDHGEEMQHLKKQLKETRDALKMEQKGGSNSSKKSERRIQQLEKVRTRISNFVEIWQSCSQGVGLADKPGPSFSQFGFYNGLQGQGQ